MESFINLFYNLIVVTKKLMTSVHTDDIDIFLLSTYFKQVVYKLYNVMLILDKFFLNKLVEVNIN